MQYLSPDWFNAANEALAVLELDKQLVVGTTVTSSESVAFNLSLGDSTRLDPTPSVEPQVSIEYSYETAVAISKGETNIREAILAEKINLGGDTIKLAEASKDLAKVAKALEPLSAKTVY